MNSLRNSIFPFAKRKQKVSNKNTGILGGSFDPFHYGHLSVVKAALAEDDLDQVVLMPAWVSPFKIGKHMAPEEDRVAMLRQVTEEYPGVVLSTIEIDVARVSYTYETLVRLQKDRPDEKLWFIMGADSLFDLKTWHKGKELLESFSFMVAPRPGYDRAELDRVIQEYTEGYGTAIRVLQNEQFHISSTEIKEAIREGRSIENLVPSVVERYIHEHGLYL